MPLTAGFVVEEEEGTGKRESKVEDGDDDE
jgi:hypothetical protein